MCFRKKKEIPLWFILDEPKPDKPPSRQGPYSHETFIHLLSQQRIESTQLIWTNERIFPNPAKPHSNRLVRLTEWRRIDQFPDPTLRKLQLEAQKTAIASNPQLQPIHGTPAPEEIPPIPPPQQYPPHQQQNAPYQQQHPPPQQNQPSVYPQQQPQYFNPHQPLPGQK